MRANQPRLPRPPKPLTSRFDAVIGRTLIDVKGGLHALRGLRSALLEMAYALVDEPGHIGLLVVVDPDITPDRVDEERFLASRVIMPEVRHRLHIITADVHGYAPLPPGLEPEVLSSIDALVHAERNRRAIRFTRPDYDFLIKQILILSWLRGDGPLTADWICETAGCTYQTFAAAIRPLGSFIQRQSDRSYELARFPHEEWARMVATSEKARHTIRYADTSGQPRTPEALVKRLPDNPAIAVAGVLGARHLDPDLDLVGTPRLDLTIHCPNTAPDLSFIERLDPSLRRIDDPDKPAHLAIHFLRRAEPFFESTVPMHAWADPTECLLDLHEARLDAQSQHFLANCIARRKGVTRG